MKITNQQLDDFIQELLGTCKSMDEAKREFFEDADGVDEDDDFTSDQLETICSEISNCETCGWWVEVGEIDENENCLDCNED